MTALGARGQETPRQLQTSSYPVPTSARTTSAFRPPSVASTTALSPLELLSLQASTQQRARPDGSVSTQAPQQMPPSPFNQPQASPLLSQPSSTSADALSPTSHGQDIQRSQPRAPAACWKCRTSKTKCTSNGLNTTCVGCQKKGIPCDWRHITENSTVPKATRIPKLRRPDSDLTLCDVSDRDFERQAPRKRRKIDSRTQYPPHTRDGSQLDEASLLNPDLLNEQVYSALFSTFEQHFATEMPFLHGPTFRQRLRTLDAGNLSDDAAALILAFVALTCPFHEDLAHRTGLASPRSSDATLDLAQHYADAAHVRLTRYTNTGSLDATQALLLLGLFTWSAGLYLQSVSDVSNAIHMAGYLGYNYQQGLDPKDKVFCRNLHRVVASGASPEAQRIDEEARRRTFWSCFIMESYLACGRGRFRSIDAGELHIQLPCSERAFIHGHNIATRTLRESEADFGRRQQQQYDMKAPSPGLGSSGFIQTHDLGVSWEKQDDQEALTWFIRALDVLRDVMYWSCNITRRLEVHAPWDERSSFYKCEQKVLTLKDQLPTEYVLGANKTRDHTEARTSRSYVLLHSVLTICEVALYRDYFPHMPFEVGEPNGPTTGPMIPQGLPRPPGYWEKCAERLFRASKAYLDMMVTCQAERKLVITPLTGFAMYMIVYTLHWCTYFPKFDTKKILCESDNDDDPQLLKNCAMARQIIQTIQEKVRMARVWDSYMATHCAQFEDAKAKFRWEATGSKGRKEYDGVSPGNSSNDGSLGPSEHSSLEDYLLVERKHKEFGDSRQDTNATVPPKTKFSHMFQRQNVKAEGRERQNLKREIKAAEPLIEESRSSQFTSLNSHATHMSATTDDKPHDQHSLPNMPTCVPTSEYHGLQYMPQVQYQAQMSGFHGAARYQQGQEYMLHDTLFGRWPHVQSALPQSVGDQGLYDFNGFTGVGHMPMVWDPALGSATDHSME